MFSERVSLRLQDIVENADAVADYIAGLDVAAFQADRKTQDAVERCLQRITEAVTQIGEEEVQRLGLGAPWHQVRGLGNRLRHEYRAIDRRVIYETVLTDLPPLRAACQRALDGHG